MVERAGGGEGNWDWGGQHRRTREGPERGNQAGGRCRGAPLGRKTRPVQKKKLRGMGREGRIWGMGQGGRYREEFLQNSMVKEE